MSSCMKLALSEGGTQVIVAVGQSGHLAVPLSSDGDSSTTSLS